MSSSTKMLKKEDQEKAFLIMLRSEINKRCQELDRESFQQEPAYVGALVGKLAGMNFQNGAIRLQTTMVNDRGPRSAEKSMEPISL
ncbi:hypothetical protein [Comamonas sp.]|uniref:hypothetical protein n=1 Tax=Comamonas sp. TaxID=34028 RepID=UPI0028A21C37|nr:hypothetical protein [Comamonas sp.]